MQNNIRNCSLVTEKELDVGEQEYITLYSCLLARSKSAVPFSFLFFFFEKYDPDMFVTKLY